MSPPPTHGAKSGNGSHSRTTKDICEKAGQYWNASDIRAMIVEYEEEEETKDYARTMETALALFIADYGDDEV